jgi:hypothetical protein
LRWPPFLDRPGKNLAGQPRRELEGLGQGGGDVGAKEQMRNEKVTVKELKG